MESSKEKQFNKWFSIFILAGMAVALIITTIFKLDDAAGGGAKAFLIISAFGSLMGILSTVASANGLIITFLFGLLDVSIYGVMCFVNWYGGGSGLGNAVLHMLYFVPMQFVGFAQWRRHRADKSGYTVKPRRLSGKGWAVVSGLFLAGIVIAYLIIARFDKSAADTFIKTAVVLDVLPLMCNILGQMLMSLAYMEQWIFWIGVNVFSIIMWSTAHLDGTSSFAAIYIIKYSFYLLNSINGLRIWLRDSRVE